MNRPAGLVFGLLGLALLAGAWASLSTGSADIDLSSLLTGNRDTNTRILLELRLPRALTAFVSGGLLALAGALMQVLLRNPLADPYVLGVSGGASTGALLALLAGAGLAGLHLAAFGGALLSTLLVFVLAHGRGQWNSTRLLLTGVVLASGWGAVISLLLALSPDTHLRGMLFWLMGDLGYASRPAFAAAVLVLAGAGAMIMAPSLNLLASGERRAASLGVEVEHLRLALYLLSSLAVASAVSLAGNIGFVGLVAPHMLRLAGLRDHRTLLPASILLGGSLLLYADALSRSLLAPRTLPVGVLTALIGVPLFLLLLQRAGGGRHAP